MKHTIQYTLNVDFEAMQAGLDRCLPEKPKLIKTPWVDICSAMDEEGSNYASITLPSPKHPELTRNLFWRIACIALPISKHVETGLFLSAYAEAEKDGRTVRAMQFTDSYQPFRRRQKPADYNGDCWFKGELFAEELQRRLNDIAKIAAG